MQRFLEEARSWIARSRHGLVSVHHAGEEEDADDRAERSRLLDGPGEVRALLRGREARKHLGPVKTWPAPLVASIRSCLDAPKPAWVFWGADAVLVYNDAVIALLGKAHPAALGLPAAESRTQISEVCEPSVEAVLSTGCPQRLADQLILTGNGSVEERYFDILLCPVLHRGDVAGVLCTATETTRRVQSMRRTAMLAELAARTALAPDERAAWSEAVAALERNPADLPYALLYAFEPDGSAVLVGTVGLALNSPLARSRLDALADSPWPVADLRSASGPLHVQDALVWPLAMPGGPPSGFFVAGVSPRQPLDDEYRAFVAAAAERLAASIGAARAREELTRRQASLERGRRRLEQRCAELTRLYEHAPIPILVVRGADFVVERLNQSAVLAAEHDLLGKPLFEAIPELSNQGFGECLKRVLETGQPEVGREVLVRLERAGHLEDRRFTFICTPLELGADPRIIIVAEDVTDHVAARAALEASEARYRDIFDGVDVSIWVADFHAVLTMLDELAAAGVEDFPAHFARYPEFLHQALENVSIVDVNDATLRLFGARDKDELKRSLQSVFVAESWHAFAEVLIALHGQRGRVRTDVVVRTLAGDLRDLMLTVAPLPATTRPSRVLVTMTDITDLKRMEQALREADRQKDEFLATLAHELRNPLAPLRSSVDLLRAAPGDMPDAVVDIIERQVEYLVRLADDLFESSRIRRGAYDLRIERVPLADVLRDALETSRPLIESAGHDLDVRVPDEPLWIDGDRMRLAQIFANLLNNAARYTPEPGRIVVEVVPSDSQVEVRLTDTGVGIPAEVMPKLFTMFGRYRGEDEPKVAGLGIGLALAKQLAEMHGGSIEAHSEGRGKGSTFIVRLPLSVATRHAPPPPQRTGRSIEGRRILVVEDDRDTAESLKLVLEANGADVRVATSGPKALATFASFAPDAVLLDIGLPGMDGYEVVRRLRAEFPQQRALIVALTGWGRAEDIERARDAGFDEHLVKPVDIDALRRLLSREVDPPGSSDTPLPH